jgi:hypothetical protein
MSRTFLRQDTQIRQSDLFSGGLTPGSTLETGSASLEGDLNSLRSQVHNLLKLQTGNWYDDVAVPSNFPGEGNAKRAVDGLNTDLHALERKRVLVAAANLSNVVVPALQNWVVFAAGELPTQTIAAVGAVTTLGTVAAFNATFGAHSLALVAGASAVSPKNLCEIEDGATRDPILSSGRTVYALFQSESSTDGSTLTDTTPNRAQLSFVRLNVTSSALEAVPVSDIAGKTVHYVSVQRKGLADLNEQDFLKGAITDTPASVVVTRQSAYDGQGTLPVEATTNSALDLNSAGIYWELRDLVNATLFRVTEGSTGGTTAVSFATDVDTLTSDAQVNTFAKGVRVATGTQRINIGETAGVIESTGVNDLRIYSSNDLYLDDLHQTGSTWVSTSGLKLATNTAEWSAFKTNYGEVSLLNAINAAKNPPSSRGGKVYATVTVTTNADTDVGGIGGGTNLSAQLPDMSAGSFMTDYDVFLNGNLLRPGANAGANNDYYPGTSLAAGQLAFEFKVKAGATPDVVCVIPYA